MTDEHSPDLPSSDPSDGPGADGAAEAELDAILAEAASLSANVSADLGEPESTTTGGEPKPPASSQDEDTGDLDTQLGQMEQLLDAAATDLGAEPTGERQPKQQETGAAEDKQATPSARAEVPAFMDEFTRPELDEEANIPSLDETPSTRGGNAAQGIVGTGISGVVGTEGLTESGQRQAAEGRCLAQPEQAPEPAPVAGQTDSTHTVARRLTQVALAACERGASLLEALDKPTANLSGSVRRVIGWIAIATVGTSLLLMLMSLV